MKDVRGVFELLLEEDAVNNCDFNTTIYRFEKRDSIKTYYKNEKEFRKAIKKAYKNNPYTSKKNESGYAMMLKHKSLINSGRYWYKWSDGSCDYTSWKDWYLIEVPTERDADKMKREAHRFLNHHIGRYISFEAEPINSPYDCTGLTFSEDMKFTVVGKNRVLATKYYGVDV